MILPNVVIAGTPKSGTSSLFRWLADHPQVCASKVKETRFLLDRGDPLFQPGNNYHNQRLEGYGAFFANSCLAAGARVRLEATPHYIYQQTAREVLAKLDPPPRIIILLRKPADRVYSAFQYTQQNLGLLPKELSFREFVASIRNGATDLSQAPIQGTSVEREVAYSCYINYLRAWRGAFPRDRLHLFLFEDLAISTRNFMRRLSERLGIDAEFYDEYPFPRLNPTVRIRSASIQRIARKTARVIPTGALKQTLKRWYFFAQTDRPTASADDDRAAVAELERDYIPYNRQLSRELGLDLSSWEPANQR